MYYCTRCNGVSTFIGSAADVIVFAVGIVVNAAAFPSACYWCCLAADVVAVVVALMHYLFLVLPLMRLLPAAALTLPLRYYVALLSLSPFRV